MRNRYIRDSSIVGWGGGVRELYANFSGPWVLFCSKGVSTPHTHTCPTFGGVRAQLSWAGSKQPACFVGFVTPTTTLSPFFYLEFIFASRQSEIVVKKTRVLACHKAVVTLWTHPIFPHHLFWASHCHAPPLNPSPLAVRSVYPLGYFWGFWSA